MRRTSIARVARRLKRAGLKTVQYVSPQIWAWRQSRAETMREVRRPRALRAAVRDEVLRAARRQRQVHRPPARRRDSAARRQAPRRAPRSVCRPTNPLLAVLPGSRRSEVSRSRAPFMATAAWLKRERPDLDDRRRARERVDRRPVPRVATSGVELPRPPRLITGRAREVMAAADVVLTASGTASLEALLLKRPMVVAHRIVPLTYWIVRWLGVAKLPHFSLPNLLAGRDAGARVRAAAGPGRRARPRCARRLLDGNMLAPGWYDSFAYIHRQLRCDASASAAREVLALVRGSR